MAGYGAAGCGPVRAPRPTEADFTPLRRTGLYPVLLGR
ncbi:hypothetical protein KCH_19330 [Kitasatospora cheerisanensis KCTC 2395]|uniref:Uncharacterized protein n=1 Tax=Kitasatospora cheerisanensis KCTC 2395 TaxID=1348663 RepID=A0A066Z721_9ACTN|nr:hypothetical protein KCH_19330 [Kitasatospora cheerisanensis KCTC 2395]